MTPFCKLWQIMVKSKYKLIEVKDLIENENPGLYITNLQGMCALGSTILFEKLKEHNLNPTLGYKRAWKSGHVFILCDNYILDITAAQFGKGPYFIQHEKDKYLLGSTECLCLEDMNTYNWWCGEQLRFNSITALKLAQTIYEWPEYQKVENVYKN